MKKINNRGFTLVELLAVLVILITILTIAIPSITSSVDRNKEKILNKKIDIIEVSAETFVNQYKNKFVSFEELKKENCCIPVEKLKDYGTLKDEDLIYDKNKKIEGNICYDQTKKKYIYHEESTGKTDCVIKEIGE